MILTISNGLYASRVKNWKGANKRPIIICFPIGSNYQTSLMCSREASRSKRNNSNVRVHVHIRHVIQNWVWTFPTYSLARVVCARTAGTFPDVVRVVLSVSEVDSFVTYLKISWVKQFDWEIVFYDADISTYWTSSSRPSIIAWVLATIALNAAVSTHVTKTLTSREEVSVLHRAFLRKKKCTVTSLDLVRYEQSKWY